MRQEENTQMTPNSLKKGNIKERYFHDHTFDAIKEKLNFGRAKTTLPATELGRPESTLPATEWQDSSEEECKSNASRAKLRSYEFRKGYIDLLCTGRKHIFFTVAFKNAYSDEEAIESLKFFIKAVNREVFGPRWKESGLSINGACVAEPHEVSVDFRGNLHFHMLLEYQPRIEDVVNFKKSAIKAAFHVKDRIGRHPIDKSVLNVQPIWDMHGLAVYLTKSICTHQWRWGDNIFFIYDGWLDGFAVPEDRKRWEY